VLRGQGLGEKSGLAQRGQRDSRERVAAIGAGDLNSWWVLGRRVPNRWAVEEGAEADRWADFRRAAHATVSEGEGGIGSPRGGLLPHVGWIGTRRHGSGLRVWPIKERKKIQIFYLGFLKRTENELTQEKWLGISKKFENLAGCRLHHLEQLSY
jgi:hypothetical protein